MAINQQATTDENTPISIYWLTYGDTDSQGETLSVVSVSQGAFGSTALKPDGTVLYTPNANRFGTDTFTYTISNTDGVTATAAVTVTVNHVKPPPVANSQNVTTNQNVPVAVTLSGSDVEGAALSFFIESEPTHGTLSAVGADNRVTYVPNGSFYGTDTFTYEATDGALAGPPATVNVTVSQVTQGPGVTITQLGGSTQVSELSVPGDDRNAAHYTVVLNTQPAGDVTVTPSPDSQLNVTPVSLTFTAGNWSVPQTVTVSAVDDNVVRPEPDLALITHVTASTDPAYNNIAVASVTASVVQGHVPGVSPESNSGPIVLDERTQSSATYTVDLTSKPTAAVTVTLNGGSRIALSATTLTFTPDTWDTPQTVTAQAIHDGIPEGYQEVDVQQTTSSADPLYQGVTALMPLHIIDADAPNAIPSDVASVDESASVTVNLLAHAIDPFGYPLTVTGVGQPAQGSVVLNANGTATYTAPADWYGADGFSYTIANGHGGSDAGTATVTVNPVNRPPVVTNPGSQANAEDDNVSLQISATDPDGNGLVYTATGLPSGLVIDPQSGLIRGWIDPRGHGTDTTSVTATDLDGERATVSFPWNVAHINHPPFLKDQGVKTTQVGYYVTAGGPLATDIDGNQVSFMVNGLPPGMNYNAAQNYYFGTASVAGTYNVQVTADDGHGGTAQNTFIWRVLPDAFIPSAYIDFGMNPIPATLVNPPVPVQANIRFSYPPDPSATFLVSLTVTPSGRSLIDMPMLMLHDGQSVPVTITPTAVSQQVEDVAITATVDGQVTDRYDMTNIGVVLPNRVRAPDTPQGMTDRISLGGGTWGSFQGAASVYPNLMGWDSVSLAIQRPQPDDKYGNATVDPSDVARLSVASHSVLRIYGAVQTAPTPDGMAGNASQLQLTATLPGNPTAVLVVANSFSVAAEPNAVKASNAMPQNALGTPANIKWFWGAQYTMTFISDSGNNADLDKIYVSEELHVSLAGGWFRKLPLDKQASWLSAIPPANATFDDFNGLSAFANMTQNDAKATVRDGINAGGGTDQKNERQLWRFYDSRTQGAPKKLEDAKVILKSGFYIYTFSDARPATLKVERRATAMDQDGVEKGVLDKTAAGVQKVVI